VVAQTDRQTAGGTHQALVAPPRLPLLHLIVSLIPSPIEVGAVCDFSISGDCQQ
jgi:hypothetical protein